MPHKYSAENHDWDLTLYAARELFQVGRIMNERPRTGTLSMGFSAFVGSMLLSFSAIESFSASVAFSMPQTERFRDFNFDIYRRTQRFWGKIELLFSATGQVIDKSQGIFQSILEMQQWRNLVKRRRTADRHRYAAVAARQPAPGAAAPAGGRAG